MFKISHIYIHVLVCHPSGNYFYAIVLRNWLFLLTSSFLVACWRLILRKSGASESMWECRFFSSVQIHQKYIALCIRARDWNAFMDENLQLDLMETHHREYNYVDFKGENIFTCSLWASEPTSCVIIWNKIQFKKTTMRMHWMKWNDAAIRQETWLEDDFISWKMCQLPIQNPWVNRLSSRTNPWIINIPSLFMSFLLTVCKNHLQLTTNFYFWFKYDLGQKYHASQVLPNLIGVRPYDLQIIPVQLMSLIRLL